MSSENPVHATLYSLQHRILQNNTIAKVVMGVGDSKDGNGNYMNDMSNEGLKKSSNVFVSTLVKSFYRINLIPEDDRETPAGKEDDQVVGNRVCPDMDQDVLDEYKKIEADPATIIGFVNKTCKAGNVADKYGSKTGLKSSSKVYAFTFIPLVSTLIGILFVLIFAWLTIEIAVRAIKLAILRLLAPVPIISYMDPKGGKDGAFNAWVKTLTSTYLDLFVRVATVYFVIYMIQQMISHGITTSATGALKTWTIIFIFLGLFYFAKEAPKFIKQVLGIKDDGGTGIFGGVGKVLGLGAAGLGMVGSAMTNYRAARDENAELHKNSRINGIRNVGSALAGAIAGGAVGLRAATGKDASLKSVLAAQNQRNATRAAHSTMPGRFADTAYGVFTGKSLADRSSEVGEANKTAFSSLKNWKDSVKSEAIKNGGAFDYTLANGKQLKGVRYSEILAGKEAGADQNGNITINGQKYEASLFGTDVMDSIADAQVAAWQNGSERIQGYDSSGNAITKSYTSVVTTGKLSADHERVIKAVNDAQITVNGNSGASLVDSYSDLGTAMGIANKAHQETETTMKQRMRIANKQKNGK